MELMQIRRALLQPHIKTIGGLPVLIDNAYYPNGNGLVTSYNINQNFFISGVYDTGSTGKKSITHTRYMGSETGTSITTSFRLFNDLNATSVDFWTLTVTPPTARTVTTAGRFILVSIAKSVAADMYMYYTSGGQQIYLFKGKNVT